jgi:hypothetical protein
MLEAWDCYQRADQLRVEAGHDDSEAEDESPADRRAVCGEGVLEREVVLDIARFPGTFDDGQVAGGHIGIGLVFCGHVYVLLVSLTHGEEK